MLKYVSLYLHNFETMMKELPGELCAPAKSCAGDVPATPFLLQAGQGKQERLQVGILVLQDMENQGRSFAIA